MSIGKKMIYSFAMLLFMGTTYTQAMAEDALKYKNFAQVKLGYFQPTSDMDDDDYDPGVNGSISYNRYLTKNFIFEVGLTGYGSDDTRRGVNGIAGSYKQENCLAVSALVTNLKGEIAVGDADLYAGAGIGLYTATLFSEIESSRLGSFDRDESDTVMGGQFIIGARYNITSRWFAGVEGIYRITDKVDIDKTVIGVPVEYAGNLNGFTVTATAGFRF